MTDNQTPSAAELRETIARTLCEARGMRWHRLTPFGLNDLYRSADMIIAALVDAGVVKSELIADPLAPRGKAMA